MRISDADFNVKGFNVKIFGDASMENLAKVSEPQVLKDFSSVYKYSFSFFF